MSDAEFLLSCRNDPETVRQSLQRQPVTMSEHLAWLEAALDTPRCQLYVAWARIRDGEVETEEVGTGRLDVRDNGSVEVSLTVAPKYRGCGFGKELLAALVEKAKEYGFRRLKARVRVNNVASMITFLKAGFVTFDDHVVEMERECPTVF